MKSIVFTIIFFLLMKVLVLRASADTSVNIQDNGSGSSSNVHVENSVGQNTTCVNGSCSTTSSGNNSATVCINGNCTTSPDGNIDRQEGGASVHIQNNSNGFQTNPSGVVVPSVITVTPLPTDMPIITPTATPSAKQKSEKHSSKQKVEQLQSQPMSIEAMISSIGKFFTDLFSGSK